MNTLSPRAGISSHSPQQSPPPLRITGAALLVAALVLLFNGCATTPLDRAAKSLASTVATVDVAMQGYSIAFALGTVRADDHRHLQKLYTDYQAAETLAETAITNAIKSGDAGSLAAVTAALEASKFQLLAFIARFTTSPPKP